MHIPTYLKILLYIVIQKIMHEVWPTLLNKILNKELLNTELFKKFKNSNFQNSFNQFFSKFLRNIKYKTFENSKYMGSKYRTIKIFDNRSRTISNKIFELNLKTKSQNRSKILNLRISRNFTAFQVIKFQLICKFDNISIPII